MSSSSSDSSGDSVAPNSTKRKGRHSKAEVSDSDSSDVDSDTQPQLDIADEPVLSHADQRRKRKAERRQETAKGKEEQGGSPSKKRKLDNNGKFVPVHPSSEKSKYSIWVGNMSFKTTRENLKTFFQDVGEVTRIYMPTKPVAKQGMKPENRGFAYVDFATEEAKVAAIALSESPLVGRKLLIKDGNDFAGRPRSDHITTGPVTHSKTAQKLLRAQKQPPAPTLFLGNLGFETTEQDIRQLLEAHRPKNVNKKAKTEEGATQEGTWLRKIRMGTFEDSGLCKGFAFVDFTSIEHATATLVNPKNHQLNGRKLVVEYASADAVRRGAPKSKSKQDGRPVSPDNKEDGFSHTKNRPRHRQEESKERLPLSQQSSHSGTKQIDQSFSDKTKARNDHRKEEAKGGERREKGPRSRPKPGAALALAKRESAAILPNKAQKIVF